MFVDFFLIIVSGQYLYEAVLHSIRKRVYANFSREFCWEIEFEINLFLGGDNMVKDVSSSWYYDSCLPTCVREI